MNTKILRKPAVLERCGFGTTTLYKFMNEGAFPKAVRLGERAVGWIETEVDDWLARRMAERTQLATKRTGRPTAGLTAAEWKGGE